MSRFTVVLKRRSTFALAALLVVFGLGITGLGHVAAATAAKVASIQIKNFAFMPPVLTVTAGTTVTWINNDDEVHKISTAAKNFGSGGLDTDDKYSFTFAKPGIYPYFCSLHPKMIGKIIVKAP